MLILFGQLGQNATDIKLYTLNLLSTLQQCQFIQISEDFTFAARAALSRMLQCHAEAILSPHDWADDSVPIQAQRGRDSCML